MSRIGRKVLPLPKGVTSPREGKVLGRLCEILYQH